MNKSLNEQTPATKNQIKSIKGELPRSKNLLEGYIANSMNGGILKPIAYKKVMAGEKIYEYSIKGIIRMLVPKTPVAQKLKITFNTFFVPNSRVWKNAEAYTSQKGGSSETKISEIPNFGGYELPAINANGPVSGENLGIPITDTDFYRDCWISSYIPRISTGLKLSGTNNTILPKISALPARGFRAIYNDFLRNKEYDEKLYEYDEDNAIETNELNDYLPFININSPIETSNYMKLQARMPRGKRQDSYYTDYRTDIAGFTDNATLQELQDLTTLNEWSKKIAEARSEAENAQLNDWDVIAKIRGSKPLTEGKVIQLGSKTIGLNYNAVTQTAYNVNSAISEEYQQLGIQGAYSYTEFDLPMFTYKEFKEEGYLHIIAQVSADSVFETGIDRNLINVTPFDEYRPDLKDVKQDVLYSIEKGTCDGNLTSQKIAEVTGYKRKYSEYFKLPDNIAGDLTTNPYNKVSIDDLVSTDGATKTTETNYITQNTFQFFEKSDRLDIIDTGENPPVANKNIWQDYTDLLINKNQAIKNEITEFKDTNKKYLWVRGQNQVFMIGISSCITDQPIDENIKNNFTKWGEK